MASTHNGLPWQDALRALSQGETLSIQCPDGKARTLWGYNGATGDLFVAGWPGNVWMDCSTGMLTASFATHEAQ